MEHNNLLKNRLLGSKHLPSSHSNGPIVPKIDTNSVITIHVRYVPKDLWVQVDLPRDIPVHRARDLILAKCKLTSLPPQAPSSPTTMSGPALAESRMGSDSTLALNIDKASLNTERGRHGPSPQEYLTAGSSVSDGMSTRTLHTNGSSTPPRSRQSSLCSYEDESLNDQDSINDEDAELQAEELIADDMFPQSPPSCTSFRNTGFSDSLLQGLQGAGTISPGLRQESLKIHSSKAQHLSHLRSSSSSSAYSSKTSEEHAVLSQQQLQRLISYSLLHKNDGNMSGSDRGSRDGSSTSRFSGTTVWSQYRSRQSSTSARHMAREVLDHGGVLADCLGEEAAPKTETRKSECSAWKACFGLFWLEAPHCLLELQLRNNYIQLPPPGTTLSYYDHYAEGVLYKMSKKNRPDTVKKSIELHAPLTVDTIVIPQNSQNSFRLSSSIVPMSSTMITLTISPDPNVPKVSFRATSESELNNWVRIFNSLNCTQSQGLPPPFDPAALVSLIAPPIFLPPPLPPLPLMPPPTDVDTAAMLTKKRSRHNSYTSTNTGATGRFGLWGERKRSHTVQDVATLPAIDPVLIWNVAAALSNFHQNTDGDGDNNGVWSNSMSRSGSIRRDGQVVPKKSLTRKLSQEWAVVDSVLGDRDLHQLQHSPLSRQASLTRHNGYNNRIQQEERRMRSATEPGLIFWNGGSNSQRGSRQLLREHIERSRASTPDPLSNITRITEDEPRKESKTESPQDFASRALLRASCAGSSCPPTYSGYIWLYISNSTAAGSVKGDDQEDISVSGCSKPKSMSSSATMTFSSGKKAANIPIKKASGRYVKCFMTINERGQLHWVEVREELQRQQGIETQDEDEDQVVNPCYGLQLKPSGTVLHAGKYASAGVDEGVKCSGKSQEIAERPALMEREKAPVVQVSMAHKLRLHFFCIKISLSSLAEVMIELMTETTESSSSILSSSSSGVTVPDRPSSTLPSLTKKSPLRMLNRFSAPLTRKTSTSSSNSPLAPMRSVSLTKSRTRTMTMTESQGSLKKNNEAMWPSMHPLCHERQQLQQQLQFHPGVLLAQKEWNGASKTQSVPPSAKKSAIAMGTRGHEVTDVGGEESSEKVVRSVLKKTQSLFVENRSRTHSAPPGTMFSPMSDATSMAAVGDIGSEGKARDVDRVVGRMRRRMMGTLYLPEEEEDKKEDDDNTKETEKERETVEAASNVVVLANDLQKAMKRRTMNAPVDLSLWKEEDPEDLERGDDRKQRNKMSLQEITAKKRASSQQLRDLANVAAARSKLVGELGTLEEGQQQGVPEQNRVSPGSENTAGCKVEVQGQSRVTEVAATLKVLMGCPFLEQSEEKDAEGREYVSLKGYTETEDEWKMLQSALELFLEGPIKDQKSAFPPKDTLIPSYHAPRLPEVRLSEKAQNFLKARDCAAEVAVATADTAHMSPQINNSGLNRTNTTTGLRRTNTST
ncbi:hypothetical protein BGZ54_001566, partial [Gamsiella multidivaricata]